MRFITRSCFPPLGPPWRPEAATAEPSLPDRRGISVGNRFLPSPVDVSDDSGVVTETDAISRNVRRRVDGNDKRRFVAGGELREVHVDTPAADEPALLVEEKHDCGEFVHWGSRDGITHQASDGEPPAAALVPQRD